jgi:CheY-like chemotaxis protein
MDTRSWVKEPEILLVDDDDELRESIAEGLEGAGFSVTRATDGADALGHLRTSSLPSLVLLDLLMPGMNGWQLCEVMHSDPVLSEIPIVALTATASMDPESLHLADVADWIAKPFDLEQVLEVIRPFFAKHTAATAAA